MDVRELIRRPGLFIHRLSTGLWELRTNHRSLGLYERKEAARNAKTRLLKRGRRGYNERGKQPTTRKGRNGTRY